MLPLSATTISPAMLFSRKDRCAFSIQAARVSASFRQGIIMETSGVDACESVVEGAAYLAA